MSLDRKYQSELLTMLANAYPRSFHDHSFFRNMSEEEKEKYAMNLSYLDEHGLVESGLSIGADDFLGIGDPKITAKGLDFIADDGGLSAILGVITIKLHDQTVRDLLAAKIANSDLPPEDKPKWTAALRTLPADAIKHLTMKLMESGLDHVPNAIHEVGKYLGF